MPHQVLKPRRSREEVKAILLVIANNDLSHLHRDLIAPVLNDPRFWEAPASSKWHHNYDGGLAEHTAEVVEMALSIQKAKPELDRDALIVAAFWHDYAKIFDYVKEPDGTWGETDHHDEQGHLVRSYAEFRAAAASLDYPAAFIDKVSHLLLAHHGRKEWGSPKEPQTPEAWALHLADMISVRCLCDRG